MLNYLTDLFFPKTCVGCDAFLVLNEYIICTSCRHRIPLIQHHATSNNIAYKKFYGRLPLEHISVMLYFHKKGIVQHIIHNLKYHGHQEIGTLLGNWYCNDVGYLLATVDEIIPVPLHKKRMKERGFNQVTSFATAFTKGLNIPLNEMLLLRKVYSSTQTKKTLLNRSETIAEIFDVNYTEKDHNKHFLLIDDVLTTGATLENCGRALLKIPNSKLSIITIAMSHS